MYLDTIAKYEGLRKELCAAIQAYIKDKYYTLEDRWSVFEAASNARILPKHNRIQHIKAMYDVSWYDDFYKDRYTLVEWVDIIEDIEDDEDHKFYANLDAIKEEILAAGYYGFTYDW